MWTRRSWWPPRSAARSYGSRCAGRSGAATPCTNRSCAGSSGRTVACSRPMRCRGRPAVRTFWSCLSGAVRGRWIRPPRRRRRPAVRRPARRTSRTPHRAAGGAGAGARPPMPSWRAPAAPGARARRTPRVPARRSRPRGAAGRAGGKPVLVRLPRLFPGLFRRRFPHRSLLSRRLHLLRRLRRLRRLLLRGHRGGCPYGWVGRECFRSCGRTRCRPPRSGDSRAGERRR